MTVTPLNTNARSLEKYLEDMLKRVRQGKISGCAVVWAHPDTTYTEGFEGEVDYDAVVGRLFKLANLIADQTDDSFEEEDE